jgi:hypothetical protein
MRKRAKKIISNSATDMQVGGVAGGYAPGVRGEMVSGMGLGRRLDRGGGRGFGPVGECVCLNCGARVPHEAGVPCFEQRCHRFGSNMRRF